MTKDAPQMILELSANAGEIKPAAFSLYCASEANLVAMAWSLKRMFVLMG